MTFEEFHSPLRKSQTKQQKKQMRYYIKYRSSGNEYTLEK